MSLNEYRRKRKFDRTPEPDGSPGKKVRARGRLRFVVQKHAATRTHFDLRLEVDGTFKSWAVPKEPSLNPLDNRLAVEVEDHPLEYGDFEGIIPKGNYGAGTVMIWDTGTYEERGQNGRDADEETLRRGLERGKITFMLAGEKLKGEFALVRLRRGKERGKNWLLIKKRDGWAEFSEPLFDPCSVKSGRTMEQIAAESAAEGKIWIPGQGSTRLHAPTRKEPLRVEPRPRRPALPKMPHRLRAQQPVVASRVPEKGEWLYEEFLKGHRAIAEINSGGVRLYSRALLPMEKKFPAVVKALRGISKNAILDGEIVGDRYLLYDVLYWDAQDLRNTPLVERRKKLAQVSISGDILALCPFFTELRSIRSASGFAIAKRADSPYSGGLSKHWLKIPVSSHRSAARAGVPAPSDRPVLTNLDKIFWPQDGITKGDLVRYYDAIAAFILPHLIDRPQSLHRQPDGLRNEGFFQKDMAGYLPRRIATERIYSASARKTVQYLLCQDRWTLLYLVNLGCIELNPWLSRIGMLDRPDVVVIDIDPDGNAFDEVVAVAIEVRRVLREIGAQGWCKTSGASGLHICVPCRARYPYEDVRRFAETVCGIVNARMGGVTSVERAPARRRGKIYLDFLQNRRGQTLAAPYCVRPRPHATVSTPLRWSEVRRGLDPREFTMATVPRRVKRLGDLWEELSKGSLDLPGCESKLKKIR